jgi:hypothetical protein
MPLLPSASREMLAAEMLAARERSVARERSMARAIFFSDVLF